MTNRQQQIEAVAYLLADGLLTYRDGDPMPNIQRINREGWTFDTAAVGDSWIRHEGVVLSEAELAQAIEQALLWQSK